MASAIAPFSFFFLLPYPFAPIHKLHDRKAHDNGAGSNYRDQIRILGVELDATMFVEESSYLSKYVKHHQAQQDSKG